MSKKSLAEMYAEAAVGEADYASRMTARLLEGLRQLWFPNESPSQTRAWIEKVSVTLSPVDGEVSFRQLCESSVLSEELQSRTAKGKRQPDTKEFAAWCLAVNDYGKHLEARGSGENEMSGTLLASACFMAGAVAGRTGVAQVILSGSAQKAANARHSKPGGSRAMQEAMRKAWASGKYTSRDRCAEEECGDLGISFATARKALRNTPDPTT